MCGSVAIRSARARRHLPTPGSAQISTVRPLRALACDQRRSNSSISSSRPISGVAPERRASNRPSAVLGQHAPCVLRLGKALHRLRPEIRDLESCGDLPARALGNHNGVRLGQRLQPGSEVRRLPLLRRAGSCQVADHDKPGGDADAHLQALQRRRLTDAVD
jgi:hypothetical protein